MTGGGAPAAVPVSWCGEPLEGHLAATALVAWRVYRRDWLVVARRHGLPEWLLPAAALLHDVGKALPCYQGSAARACNKNRSPSYAMHEYASAYAAGLLLRAALNLPEPLRAGLKAVAAAVWKHHHGMASSNPGRLLWPARSSGWKAIEDNAGPCSGILGEEAVGNADLMLSTALKACRLAARVDPALCPPALEDLLARACNKTARKTPGVIAVYARLLALNEAPTDHGPPYIASSALLTAAVSVADSIAARAHRNPSQPLGGYAKRLLDENKAMREAALQAIEEARRHGLI